MLKKHMAACLIATAFVAAPALAQGTSTTSSDRPAASDNRSGTLGSPAMNAPGGASTAAGAGMGSSGTTASGAAGTSGTNMSGSTAPSSTGTAGTGMSTAGSGAGMTASSGSQQQTMNSGQFVERQEQGQVLASKLIGTNVIGQNNESIGDINDVVMDQSGKAIAAVIGVGGFLGIGEKDVAVRFEELKLMHGSDNAANTTGSTTTTGGTTATGATTGSTGGTTATTTAGTGSGTNQQIDRVMISMTKDQLRNAPTFRAMGDRETNSGSTAGSGNNANRPAGATGTTAPGTTRP